MFMRAPGRFCRNANEPGQTEIYAIREAPLAANQSQRWLAATGPVRRVALGTPASQAVRTDAQLW